MTITPVGIEYETQRPFAFELMDWATYSLIVGPGKSGKSDLLLTFCLAAARNLTPKQLTMIILDLHRPHTFSETPSERFVSGIRIAGGIDLATAAQPDGNN